MSAIVRLKRKATENPLEVIKASSKRRRVGGDNISGDDASVEAVFKLVGTVKEKESWSKAINSEPTGSNKRSAALPSPPTTKRQKYTLVGQLQHQNALVYDLEPDNPSPNKEGAESGRTAAEKAPEAAGCSGGRGGEDVMTCNGVEMVRTKVNKPQVGHEEDEYVYDVYKVEKDLDFRALEKLLQFEAGEDDWLFDYREGGDSDSEVSDDSNAENHWKNEYPDDDPDGSGEFGGSDNDSLEELCGHMGQITHEVQDSDEYDSAQDDPYCEPAQIYRRYQQYQQKIQAALAGEYDDDDDDDLDL